LYEMVFVIIVDLRDIVMSRRGEGE